MQLFIEITLRDASTVYLTTGQTGIYSGVMYLGDCSVSAITREMSFGKDVSTSPFVITVPRDSLENAINDKTKSVYYALDQLNVTITTPAAATLFFGRITSTSLTDTSIILDVSAVYGEIDRDFLEMILEREYPNHQCPDAIGKVKNYVYGTMADDGGALQCYQVNYDADRRYLISSFLGQDITVNDVWKSNGTKLLPSQWTVYRLGSSYDSDVFVDVPSLTASDTCVRADVTSKDLTNPGFMFTYIYAIVNSLAEFSGSIPSMITLQNYLTARGFTIDDFAFATATMKKLRSMMRSFCDSLPGVNWFINNDGDVEITIDDPSQTLSAAHTISESEISSLSVRSTADYAVNYMIVKYGYKPISSSWSVTSYMHPYANSDAYASTLRQPLEMPWLGTETAAFRTAKDMLIKQKYPTYLVTMTVQHCDENDITIKPGDYIDIQHVNLRHGDDGYYLHQVISVQFDTDAEEMRIIAIDVEHYKDLDYNRILYIYPDEIDASREFRNWALTYDTVLVTAGSTTAADLPSWDATKKYIDKNMAYFTGNAYLVSDRYYSRYNIFSSLAGTGGVTLNFQPTRNQIEQLFAFGVDTNNYWNVFRNAAGLLKFKLVSGGVTIFELTSSTTLSTGTTYHVLCVKVGANVGLYVNGTLEATTTLSSTYTLSSSARVYIGGGSSLNFAGWMNGMVAWDGETVFTVTATAGDSYTIPTAYYFDSTNYN